jgi:hypothetical protein
MEPQRKRLFILSAMLALVGIVYLIFNYNNDQEVIPVTPPSETEIKLQGRTFENKEILYAGSTAILFTFGQSNSACHGQGTYTCRNQVYEYFNGNLYLAKEPLIGATGMDGCSVWTRLADMLIDSGFFKQVVLIPAGIGNTSVQCWSEGECNKKLSETLEWISRDRIKVTHIIWHQGESDNLENTSKELYKLRLKTILTQIRNSGQKADLYVCTASYHPAVIGIKGKGTDTIIQQAQIEFVNENPGTKPGANTDEIMYAFDRHDGVHFSTVGLDKFAYELFLKINSRSQSKP